MKSNLRWPFFLFSARVCIIGYSIARLYTEREREKDVGQWCGQRSVSGHCPSYHLRKSILRILLSFSFLVFLWQSTDFRKLHSTMLTNNGQNKYIDALKYSWLVSRYPFIWVVEQWCILYWSLSRTTKAFWGTFSEEDTCQSYSLKRIRRKKNQILA